MPKMILTCLAEKKLLQIVKFFGQNVKVRAIEAHKAALSKTPTSSDVNKTKTKFLRPRPEQQDQDQDQSLQDQDQDQDQSDKTKTVL